MSIDPDDVAALRRDDDLVAYLLSLTVAVPQEPTPVVVATAEPEYVIPHRGAWPIGTAPGGPTPMDGRCSCPKCNQAA